MGQWYKIGLQAGKKVAEAVDKFIEGEKRAGAVGDNYDPKKRKVMKDGSTAYQWYMKWNPFRYNSEKRFMDVLGQFDSAPEDDEGRAYKLVCVGDEGGQDEYCNAPGENFDGLYSVCKVSFPEGWDDGPGSTDASVIEAPEGDCCVHMAIKGRFDAFVPMGTVEEMKEAGIQAYYNADFGDLHECDVTHIVHITDPEGNYLYTC